MTQIAYFDCPSGVSGDMILGALIDAGLEGERLREALAGLPISGYELRWERVRKGPLAATQVTVTVTQRQPERHLAEIEAVLEAADLPDPVRAGALAIFRRLARVEAGLHGTDPEEVHFHELGGVDTMVDVVGALWGLHHLGITMVYASPLPAARGWITSQHGPLPLPAPATLALLQGVPLVPAPVEGVELVTPTGAVLLTHVAAAFGPPPPMTLQRVGYGAGQKRLIVPNVLRLWLGETSPAVHGTGSPAPLREPLVLLETNIDDMDPQLYEHVADRLFAAGALDVYLTPVQMKKHRPGVLLSVLTRPEQADSLVGLLFAETTTLGVRRLPVDRYALARTFETVETPYGPVKVKVATLPDGSRRAKPEYEACRRLAEAAKVPLQRVIAEAQKAVEL